MDWKDENEDEEDEDEFEPFDFSEFFKDPAKILNSKRFKKMFKHIFKNLMKNLPEEYKNLSPQELQKEFMKNKSKFGFPSPFMYGFNVNFDKDGNPSFDSFGNIKPEPHGETKVNSVREPLVEVNEENDNIVVITEIPGVTKSDIELKATSNSLIISTKKDSSGKHEYYKEVELPSAINSDVAKARYANGILEVKLKKIDEEHKNIKVD